MGASGSSQDKVPDEQGQSRDNASKRNNNDANDTIQVALPHKCEDILKHACSPLDMTSTKTLLNQLYAGVFLNQGRQRYWIEKGSNRNCFTVFARDLSITWAEDTRFWHWSLLKESSDENVEVAELVNVCWLEVHGRFTVANLSPGTTYQVVFLVKLRDPAYGWEVPVNLRITLPDGSTQQQKEALLEKQRERWMEILAGEFKASSEIGGDVEFSLYEYEGGNWKRGLLIKGVIIRPKPLPPMQLTPTTTTNQSSKIKNK